MATFGKVDKFDTSKEKWAQYDSAMKKRAVLRSVIGPPAYKVLQSLLALVKPSEKAYDDLVAKLSEHYSPRDSLEI